MGAFDKRLLLGQRPASVPLRQTRGGGPRPHPPDGEGRFHQDGGVLIPLTETRLPPARRRPSPPTHGPALPMCATWSLSTPPAGWSPARQGAVLLHLRRGRAHGRPPDGRPLGSTAPCDRPRSLTLEAWPSSGDSSGSALS